MASTLTDDLAVLLRLAIDTPLPVRRKSYWKMNISYLNEGPFREVLKEQWIWWKEHKKYYPNPVMWWGRYVQGHIR